MQSNFNHKLSEKRIVFFGTPDFTVEFLDLFKKLGLNISLVVTGEDRPIGRGMQMKSPGPKIWAEKNSIKFLQPNKLDDIFFKDFNIEHEKENFDLFIVIAYGKIIPEKIINLPKHGTINLHYSLLPKYRGASPVETAILNGDTETGITIQQMVYKLDAGSILFQEKMNIENIETTTELRTKMNKRALEIFPEFLNNLFSTLPTSSEQNIGAAQDEILATSCGKFKKEDLDVTEDLKKNNLSTVYRKYKAFDRKIFFYHTYQKNNTEKIIRVKITDMDSVGILKVLPESKKEISVTDFENAFGKILL